jgi:hypothetical protein
VTTYGTCWELGGEAQARGLGVGASNEGEEPNGGGGLHAVCGGEDGLWGVDDLTISELTSRSRNKHVEGLEQRGSIFKDWCSRPSGTLYIHVGHVDAQDTRAASCCVPVPTTVCSFGAPWGSQTDSQQYAMAHCPWRIPSVYPNVTSHEAPETHVTKCDLFGGLPFVGGACPDG